MYRLSFVCLALCFASCNVINPDEQDPGFIHIPSFQFNALPGEGTSSEKITEVWVYADEKIVGVYDLPADIPVLKNGPTDLLFFGGIKNNGISTTRIRYPFYKPFARSIPFTPFSRDTVIPEFVYFNGLDISEKDFESGNFLVPAGPTQGSFTVTTDNNQVFEGTRSGIGTLDAGESILYFKDEDNLDLTSGNTIFLEMNYSCNNSFAVGLIASNGANTKKNLALIINPTTGSTGSPVWNKIYVDLGLIPLQNVNAQFFELYFEAVPDQQGKPVELYLDNLKLVQWP
jgi:hypothetical protein